MQLPLPSWVWGCSASFLVTACSHSPNQMRWRLLAQIPDSGSIAVGPGCAGVLCSCWQVRVPSQLSGEHHEGALPGTMPASGPSLRPYKVLFGGCKLHYLGVHTENGSHHWITTPCALLLKPGLVPVLECCCQERALTLKQGGSALAGWAGALGGADQRLVPGKRPTSQGEIRVLHPTPLRTSCLPSGWPLPGVDWDCVPINSNVE